MPQTITIDKEDSRPIYSQIKEQLRQKIKSGVLKSLDRLPSETEIAGTHNISRMTVRQAFAELENDGLIFREHGKGTFVAEIKDTPAEKIISSKSLAILVPCVTEGAYAKILRGVEDIAQQRGYSVIICNTDFNAEKQKKYLHKMDEEKVGGLIIVPILWGEMAIEHYTQLRADNIPFVFINRFIPEIDTDYVVADNVLGAYQAVSHLIKLGHKRIAYISVPKYAMTEQRLAGYRKAFEENGIIFDESLVKVGATKEECGYTCMKELWESKNCPTAIFAFNDNIAKQVYETATELGLKIPEDLALIGFDDSPVAGSIPVPLTTVAYPSYETGATSANILIDRIEGKGKEIQRIVLKPKLIIRESCGERLKNQIVL